MRPIALLVAALSAAAPAFAADKKPLGEFEQWSAFETRQDGGPVCYAIARPQEMLPKGVARGEVWLLVTHRPKQKARNEVSVVAGYPLKADSKVELQIDAATFQMFVSGDNAWSEKPQDDERLVSAMRKAKQIVVSGISQRGTKTTDRYALAGFVPALRAIGKACGVD